MSSPRLLDQVRDRLRVKHYSMRTENTYLQWIPSARLALCIECTRG